MYRTFQYVFRIALVSILHTAAVGADLTVTAEFKPARAAVGEAVNYVISIRETSSTSMPQAETIERINLPEIENIQLLNGRLSTGRRTNIVNSETSYEQTLTITFDARGSSPGTFQVPAFPITYKGETLTVPSATLSLLPGGAETQPSVNELVFLELEFPEQPYVGQTFEAQLKLFVEESVRLQEISQPGIRGDGFLIGELPSEPERLNEFRDERYYTTYSWPLKVTALSQGEETVSFQLEVLALLPPGEGGRRGSARLRNSFFDDFFIRPQQFMLYSNEEQPRIRPLPEAGKPEPFAGAIGQFRLQTEFNRSNAEVGEPLSLKALIVGKGNFDRIQPPAIDTSGPWRSYPPDSSFQPSDSLGLSGTLSLDYVLVPQSNGEHALPEFTFTYFDPEQERYVELNAPQRSVVVTGTSLPQTSDPNTANPAALAEAQRNLPGLVDRFGNLDQLLRIDPRKTRGRTIGSALWQQPWFAFTQIVIAAVFAFGGWQLRHRYKLASSADYAWEQEIRTRTRLACKQYRAAAATGDYEGFLSAAQEAIRARAEAVSKTPLRAGTYPEIEAALSSHRTAKATLEPFAEVFSAADALRFAPEHARGKADDLPRLRTELDQSLNALKP